MTARTLDGRALARRIRADVRDRAARFEDTVGRPPGLASVMVGDDGASLSYVRSKARQAERTGLAFHLEQLPEDASTGDVVSTVTSLQRRDIHDGIIVEMPLPRHIDVASVQHAIDPRCDADGVAPSNLGRLASGLPGPRPATPLAVLALLEEARASLEGASALVIGRSKTVGLPVALMLLERDATVTIAHSRTRALEDLAGRATILVAAAGRPDLIGAEHVRPGAVVIDVGTTWIADDSSPRGGRLAGDVHRDVAGVAGAVSPVPGGVGPVTTAMLLRTVLDLAEGRET